MPKISLPALLEVQEALRKYEDVVENSELRLSAKKARIFSTRGSSSDGSRMILNLGQHLPAAAGGDHEFGSISARFQHPDGRRAYTDQMW